MRWLARSSLLLLALGCAEAPQQPAAGGLVGPVWQLVRFRGGDGRVLTPIDGSQYTLQFQADGRVSARIDCNRGSGGWKSAGKNQIEFTPMAVTRAMCPPGSMDMHDHILKQIPHIRSYVIKNGRLYLSLMADGGTYELAPAR
jgi:para-nitrobenzyl esterase